MERDPAAEQRKNANDDAPLGLDLALDELVAHAEDLLDLPYRSGWESSRALKQDPGYEMIEGADSVTVIIQDPGCAEDELEVTASQMTVKVKTAEASFESRLPAPVDPSSLRRDYRNGVLSVILAKVA